MSLVRQTDKSLMRSGGGASDSNKPILCGRVTDD